MKYEAILLDFDGTLTKVDILDYLAQSINKGDESRELSEKFQSGLIDGINCLVQRVGLLSGMEINSLQKLLGNELLRPGYEAFQSWLRASGLQVILASGNICPVVKPYQRAFNAQKVFCSTPTIENGRIVKLELSRFGKQLTLIQNYFAEINIAPEKIIAVGDDLSDVKFFKFCGFSIAFNPKGEAGSYAKQVINGDLNNLCKVLNNLA